MVTVIAGLVAAFLLMPVGYVIQRPGPTVNVLGKQGETEVFEFSEPETDAVPSRREATDDDGELRMVTVSEIGGPGSTVRGIDLLRAWFSPGATIRKYSDLYDDTVTAEQLKESGAAAMTSSHSTAFIAAMDYLGVPMDSTLTIVAPVPGSDAEGKFFEDDVMISMTTPDGTRHLVDRPSVPFDLMRQVPAGSEIVVEVNRKGEILKIPVTSSADPGADPEDGSKMGIYLNVDTDVPLEVSIHLERIGGPSAGLIFSLGIIDQLTPGGITGGEVIAGTGSMSFSGDVVPIGGVKQKMYGALRDGAQWFLVPQANCADVLGNEPAGLRVIPVATLRQAMEAVEVISTADGADVDDLLPTCEAAG